VPEQVEALLSCFSEVISEARQRAIRKGGGCKKAQGKESINPEPMTRGKLVGRPGKGVRKKIAALTNKKERAGSIS